MPTKRGRKPKYLHTIVLDGINAREIYKKFKHNRTESKPPIILEYSSKSEEKSTQIVDLEKKQSIPIFIEPKDRKIITMLDYVNYGCLPERTDLCCRYDGHPFKTCPIGIPIKYVPKRPDVSHVSYPEPDAKNRDDDVITGTNDYFLTFGIVCSFPCLLAFLRDNGNKAFFKQSKSLTHSLYSKIFSQELKVAPAPELECLAIYGGPLSIEEFRNSFCTVTYTITSNIKRPYMVAVGKYIEKTKC